MFIYLMNDVNPLNAEVIASHVDHLRRLQESGKLVLCGPFTDYPGGMVAFTAESRNEAIQVAEADPFIALGYKTYELRTLEEANTANNFLL